jgi:putative ATP-binding cassette transporter
VTLRELLVPEGQEQVITDDQIKTTLDDAGLDTILVRAGGLDTEHDWSAILSLGEQQLLSLTRLIFVRPAFAMLDRVTASFKPALVREALRRLDENSITYVAFAEDVESVELYDAVLNIDADGGWAWNRISCAA